MAKTFKEKIADLFRKVWAKVDTILKAIDKQAEEYVPVIINVCENLKKAIANGTFDTAALLIDAIVPGDQSKYATIIKKFLIDKLPSIIANLQLVDILAEIDKDDIEGQFKIIYEYLTNGSTTAVNAVCLELSQEILNALSDGKFTKAERHAIIERYYNKIVINNEL